MSTQYSLNTKPCDCCGRSAEVVIGTYVHMKRFTLFTNAEEFSSWAGWKEKILYECEWGGSVVNEYSREMPPEDFIKMVESTSSWPTDTGIIGCHVDDEGYPFI